MKSSELGMGASLVNQKKASLRVTFVWTTDWQERASCKVVEEKQISEKEEQMQRPRGGNEVGVLRKRKGRMVAGV